MSNERPARWGLSSELLLHRQGNPGKPRAIVKEGVLGLSGVGDGWGAARTLVKEVLTRHPGRRFAADREPSLGDRGKRHVIGCTRATHLCRHPAGLDGVGPNVIPASGDPEGQDDVEQLAV